MPSGHIPEIRLLRWDVICVILYFHQGYSWHAEVFLWIIAGYVLDYFS